MALKLITAPAAEPVTIPEAKDHLRVDGSSDDVYIASLITLARKVVEQESLHCLITQTWDLFLNAFPGSSQIMLPLPPLQSVISVNYTPDGGSETEFAVANYIVDTNSNPGRIYLKTTTGGGTGSWPSNVLVPINGVRIRFVCGFGAATANVDPRAIQAMYLLIGHYYENREAVFMGRTSPADLPMGVTALCWDLRASVMGF